MLSIWVRSKVGSEQINHVSGPLEFGRGPQQGGISRTVLPDPTISTNQCRVEERPDGSVFLKNLSGKVAMVLADGTRIEPGAESTLRPPVRLHVGERIIEIVLAGSTAADGEAARHLQSIGAPVSMQAWRRQSSLATMMTRDPNAAELTRWFEALISVQRAAASSPDFFTEVARAVVELIGLDRGMVLLHSGEKWIPVAIHDRTGVGDETDFSHAVLNRVLVERLTFFQQEMPTSSSLLGVSAVVAAPILDHDQRVVGAVYGARGGGGGVTEIRTLEAQLTQVLAASVSAGLARLDVEAEAARSRVQFEQFFTADLAVELDRDPALLEGREREITALFADIRGFSGVSEQLSARVACDLIRDVMELLTAQARAHGGVVVDYQGDGLLAMWNAPIDQPDHAARACDAALAMQRGLPALNARWQARIGRNLGLGIGINTGLALVGNTGSRIKFKYGPLGHTVNVASRVEGATKQFGVGVLITGETQHRIAGQFATRRLCTARVLGIAGGIELHELHAKHADPEWCQRRDAYEAALARYEEARWSEACQALVPLLPRRAEAQAAAYDVPTLTLLATALECLRARPAQFDPVMTLASK